MKIRRALAAAGIVAAVVMGTGGVALASSGNAWTLCGADDYWGGDAGTAVIGSLPSFSQMTPERAASMLPADADYFELVFSGHPVGSPCNTADYDNDTGDMLSIYNDGSSIQCFPQMPDLTQDENNSCDIQGMGWGGSSQVHVFLVAYPPSGQGSGGVLGTGGNPFFADPYYRMDTAFPGVTTLSAGAYDGGPTLVPGNNTATYSGSSTGGGTPVTPSPSFSNVGFIETLQGFFLGEVVARAMGLMAIVLSIGVLTTWGRRAIKSR